MSSSHWATSFRARSSASSTRSQSTCSAPGAGGSKHPVAGVDAIASVAGKQLADPVGGTIVVDFDDQAGRRGLEHCPASLDDADLRAFGIDLDHVGRPSSAQRSDSVRTSTACELLARAPIGLSVACADRPTRGARPRDARLPRRTRGRGRCRAHSGGPSARGAPVSAPGSNEWTTPAVPTRRLQTAVKNPACPPMSHTVIPGRTSVEQGGLHGPLVRAGPVRALPLGLDDELEAACRAGEHRHRHRVRRQDGVEDRSQDSLGPGRLVHPASSL